MASPQREHGFTGVANEIIEHLARLKINGTQFRIIMVVFRYTYGFQRKEHELSESFIARATGINIRQIKRELADLLERKIITLVRAASFTDSRIIAFNKDHEGWVGKSINRVVSNSSPGSEKDTSPGDRLVPTPGVGLDTQERKLKENYKETMIILNSEESAFISILEKVKGYPINRVRDIEMYKTLQERYPNLNLIESLKDWHIYKLDNPLKPKDNPRAQINTSFKNCVKWGKNSKQLDNQVGSSSGRDYSKVKM